MEYSKEELIHLIDNMGVLTPLSKVDPIKLYGNDKGLYMNNVLYLGDVHWGVRGDSELFRSYQVDFFKETLFPYIIKHKIKHIIQVGDLFDRRKFTNHITLDIARREFFDKLIELGVSLDIIIGNHDCFYTNTNELNTSGLFLGEYKNIKVFSEPTERIVYGVKYLYLPWVNIENQEKTIELIKTTESKIILGHLEIQGFEMFEGSIACSNGFEPSIFERFDAVLSGHFHQPSEYSNIRYIGAIAQFTWSDHGCDRGFYVFNPHKGILDLEFVVNPFNPFRKVYYDESIDIIEYDYNALKDKIVKVIVTEKDDLDKFDLFIDMIRKSGVSSYKVIDNSIYHYFESEIDESVLSEDTLAFVNTYIESINIENKADVHEMFREIYLEAINLVETG